MTGRVFEIREFTLHDGPGIRTTVFLKGCPLRCRWCHNPEGQSFAMETLRYRDGREKVAGEDWTPEELADELLANADIMESSGGGVTFSGGEPLAQPDFVEATVAAIRKREAGRKIGLAVETSGQVSGEVYRRIVPLMDFVYQDLKLHDAAAYRRWTGGDLGEVLANVAWLKASGVRHAFRTPLIPGVNDGAADRELLQKIAGDSPIQFLPANPAAGAKYSLLGREWYGYAL